MSESVTANCPDSWFIPWWLVLIEGIALVILGLLFLALPATTALLAVSFLGLYWLISGICRIVSIFVDSKAWSWKLAAGVVGILAGILVIQHPLWSTLLVGNTLILLLGIGSIIIGAINLSLALKGAGWGAGILGIVSILIGLFLLANILVATLAVPWVLGVLAIAGGILAIIMAFRLQRMDKEYKAASFAAPKAPALDIGQGVSRAVAVEGGEAATDTSAAAAGMAEAALTGAKEAAADTETVIADWGEGMADTAAETLDRAGDLGANAGAAVAAAAETATEGTQATAAGVAAAVEESTGTPGAAIQPRQGPGFPRDLEYIEGIGPVFARTLKGIGIDTPRMLLDKGATPKGRAEIAEQSGISGKLILTWVNHVDLFRIKGVGSEYADLLEAAGVDTVVELATRNAANLYQKLVTVNGEKKLVRRLPVEAEVRDWVEQAKKLPRKIQY